MSEQAAEPVEPSAVHAPGTDISRYAAAVPEEYRARFVMAPEEAKELDRQLRECMRAVLVPDVDYGLIPGMGNKPSLFKPGAEKLLQWFGFGFTNDEVKTERDDPEHPSGIADKARRIGVTYRCTVYKELADGRRVTVATCEAYAGYDEDKFFVTAEDARRKAEAKERQNAKTYKREPNSAKWEFAMEYRAPWNSVMKMCEKRSLVGAAIDATAAAGLFTQDLEDMKRDAAGDAAGTVLAETGSEMLRSLHSRVREELNRWYRAKGWPPPMQWNPEQWLAAFLEAGRISAAGENSQPAAAAAQNAEAAGGWRERSLARVPSLATLGECRGLWAESSSMVAAGQCTREDAGAVQAALRARMAELDSAAKAMTQPETADVPETEISEAEAQWMMRIAGIETAADAEKVAEEMLRHLGNLAASDPRVGRLRKALAERSGAVADVLTGTVA